MSHRRIALSLFLIPLLGTTWMPSKGHAEDLSYVTVGDCQWAFEQPAMRTISSPELIVSANMHWGGIISSIIPVSLCENIVNNGHGTNPNGSKKPDPGRQVQVALRYNDNGQSTARPDPSSPSGRDQKWVCDPGGPHQEWNPTQGGTPCPEPSGVGSPVVAGPTVHDENDIDTIYTKTQFRHFDDDWPAVPPWNSGIRVGKPLNIFLDQTVKILTDQGMPHVIRVDYTITNQSEPTFQGAHEFPVAFLEAGLTEWKRVRAGQVESYDVSCTGDYGCTPEFWYPGANDERWLGLFRPGGEGLALYVPAAGQNYTSIDDHFEGHKIECQGCRVARTTLHRSEIALPTGASGTKRVHYIWGTVERVRATVHALEGTSSGSPPETAPTQSEPSGSIDSQNPTFRWSSVPSATSYRLKVRQNGVIVPGGDVQTSATSATVAALAVNNAYTWTVRAANSNGEGPPSPERTFNVVPLAPKPTVRPTVVGPEGCISDATPMLEWSAVPDAVKYYLVVYAVTPSGDSLIVNDVNVSDTSYQFGYELAGTYRWKVKGTNGSGAGPYSVDAGTYFTVNCVPVPVVSIAAPTIIEGTTAAMDTHNVSIPITLSAVTTSTVTVAYATSNGTAVAGSDYVTTSGTASFVPGALSGTIQVPIFRDGIYEPTETFTVTLSQPSGATIGQGVVTISIKNDDISWRVVGVGDFGTSTNGAPDGKADLFWRDLRVNAPGETGPVGGDRFWFMNGLTRTTENVVDSVADPLWKVVGVGDFGPSTYGDRGDGKLDLLWRHQGDGRNYVWFMNGGTHIGGAYITCVPGCGPVTDTDWEIVGVGDFGSVNPWGGFDPPDYRPDILWRHKVTGEKVVWFVEGMRMVGYGYLPYMGVLDWRIVGLGDFGSLPPGTGNTTTAGPLGPPDGKVDILWRAYSGPAVGVMTIWAMDGVNKTGAMHPNPPDCPPLPTACALRALRPEIPQWKVVGLGDFGSSSTNATPDGKIDIVWQTDVTAPNTIVIWYLDGFVYPQSENYGWLSPQPLAPQE